MKTISVHLTGAAFDPRWLTDAGFRIAEDGPDAVIFVVGTMRLRLDGVL